MRTSSIPSRAIRRTAASRIRSRALTLPTLRGDPMSTTAAGPATLTERERDVQERARAFVDEVLVPLEERAERARGGLEPADVARVRREGIDRGLSGGLHAVEHGGQGRAAGGGVPLAGHA